jgi:hypothetical protein
LEETIHAGVEAEKNIKKGEWKKVFTIFFGKKRNKNSDRALDKAKSRYKIREKNGLKRVRFLFAAAEKNKKIQRRMTWEQSTKN